MQFLQLHMCMCQVKTNVRDDAGEASRGCRVSYQRLPWKDHAKRYTQSASPTQQIAAVFFYFELLPVDPSQVCALLKYLQISQMV